MNEPFVPLNKSAVPNPARSDFRVTIVSEAESVRPFQALGHAGKPGEPCEPRVTLDRDGIRVTAIHVHCSCGQVIELSCIYQNLPPSKP